MKRSDINKLLRDSVEFCTRMNFRLPPYAFWSPGEWRSKDSSYDSIRRKMLGWDITDFGSGRFEELGLILFLLRCSEPRSSDLALSYAERVMIVSENQHIPFHFHKYKMEDVVNRSGGNLMIQLYGSLPDGEFSGEDITITQDGHTYSAPSGIIIRLTPGESLTVPLMTYHSFWGEPGCGRVLAGEISNVSDPRTDNHFYDLSGRFPDIEEDELPLFLLSTDYATA